MPNDNFFYESDHLPPGLFKSCIIPRPIGWVSTIDREGRENLAPFSYFNAVCDSPPMVMFSTTGAHKEGGPKDSLKNIEETKEFVINLATFNLREKINLSSADLPRGISEFVYAGLERQNSTLVKPPRVKESPINIECTYFQSIQLPALSENTINRMMIGYVRGIHISAKILKEGKIDLDELKPIARLGYDHYAFLTQANIFSMRRPGSFS
jgi:flavin reductase (DIM6/NTAB) family NADH-FMN oxidoreductase RutF